MMILAIAWRNVWRNPARSGVVIAAIAIGLWAGIFSAAFMEGMASQFIYSSIHTETGHIQIHHPDFMLNHDMQDSIARTDVILAHIRQIAGVTGASQNFQMFALGSTATASEGIMLNGINPEDEKSVSDIANDVVTGSYFGGEKPNQIVIGQKLANKLHANVNSKIILTLQTVSGDIIYGAFKVCGVYHTTNTDFDGGNVFVRFDDLRRLVGFAPTTATSIKIILNSDEVVQAVADTLQRQFPALKVQPWATLSPLLMVMSGWIKDVAFALVMIIMCALAFGIINTMLMAVMERTREIGMLMAIGMRPPLVFRMIVLETTFLAFTGAAIGSALSVTSVLYFGRVGINLSAFAEGLNTFGYSPMVYPSIDVAFYGQLGVLVFAIAVAASLLPARRGTHLKPVDALRGE